MRNTIVHLCPKNLGLQFNDIEQDARLRLWRALQSEREIVDLTSYLYRIAATTTIDAVRRVQARREEALLLDEEEGESEVSSLAARPEDSPERVAARQQILRKVEAVLVRLPSDRRGVVRLYLQGFTSQEMADLMGWSEPKVRNLTYRGLSDLRQQLRAEGIKCEID